MNRRFALGCALLVAVCCGASAAEEPRGLVYREVGGQALKAFVFAPPSSKAPAPAILVFHGGGWSMGEPAWTFPTAQRLAKLGFVAIAVHYRLTRGEVTPIEALADTCAAFAWVRANAASLGVDPKRVGAYGVSAGGQLVSAAATVGCGSEGGSLGNGGPDALALSSPALDMAGDRWFASLLKGRATAASLSPLTHVRPRMPPTVIIQGAEDNLTPAAGAKAFCESSRAGGNVCDLHVYPGVGHLLTRNLKHQESNFDPDPVARADGLAKVDAFLRALWLSGDHKEPKAP